MFNATSGFDINVETIFRVVDVARVLLRYLYLPSRWTWAKLQNLFESYNSTAEAMNLNVTLPSDLESIKQDSG